MILTKKQGRSSSKSGYEIQKICDWNIHSRTRTFGAEVHRSSQKMHNNYENSELYWKTQLLLKWFAYQAQSYWNSDLWSRGTNFWDTLQYNPKLHVHALLAHYLNKWKSLLLLLFIAFFGSAIFYRLAWRNLYLITKFTLHLELSVSQRAQIYYSLCLFSFCFEWKA